MFYKFFKLVCLNYNKSDNNKNYMFELKKYQINPDSYLFLRFIQNKVRGFILLDHEHFSTIVPVGKFLIIGLVGHCLNEQCFMIDSVNLFGEVNQNQYLSSLIYEINEETLQCFQIENIYNYKLSNTMIININSIIENELVYNFTIQDNNCVLKSDYIINNIFNKMHQMEVRSVCFKKKIEF